MNHPAISAVIPIFNEETTVVSSLESLKKDLISLGIVYEIIAVDDGSTDGTAGQLKNIEGITILKHRKNRGYGASLKLGISHANFDWILTIDADGSHPSSEIKTLLAQTEDNDLVIGARTGDHDTFARKLGRHIVRSFAEYITGAQIPDINSGFRLFKKKLAIQFWHLFPERYSFSSTLTVATHISDHEVIYVPVAAHKRQGGKSSIKPGKDFFGFLSLVTRLAVYFKPLKVFVPLGLSIMALAVIIVSTVWFLTRGVLDATFTVLIVAGLQIIIFGLIADMIVKRFYSSYQPANE